MTKEEMDAICKVVCAKYTTPGMHSLLCPYTMERWKAGKKEEHGLSKPSVDGSGS